MWAEPIVACLFFSSIALTDEFTASKAQFPFCHTTLSTSATKMRVSLLKHLKKIYDENLNRDWISTRLDKWNRN